MRLFFDSTGPMMIYRDDTLQISDLNPEIKTQWRMSRKEMFVFGLRCVMAAMVLPRWRFRFWRES